MLAKPVEVAPAKPEITAIERIPAAGAERRRRTRLQVHWPVRFRGAPLTVEVRTTTSNLSTDGFYCLSQTPLLPGAVLNCELSIPAYGPDFPHQELSLECSVRIVRIDSAKDDGSFGIACQIADYHLAHGASLDGQNALLLLGAHTGQACLPDLDGADVGKRGAERAL